MNILVIDVGGTNVKVLATGEATPRKAPSGKKMTAAKMVETVQQLSKSSKYDAAALGYPGRVIHGQIVEEPKNLAPGWVGFDFERALGCPVKIMNDACMQALGSYEQGRMLFLGLGTSLGTALVVDDHVIPLSLGDLPLDRNTTFESAVNRAALETLGPRRWRKSVNAIVPILKTAFEADHVVLGGGNAKRLRKLPADCRQGSNDHAFIGGFRMWEDMGAPRDTLRFHIA